MGVLEAGLGVLEAGLSVLEARPSVLEAGLGVLEAGLSVLEAGPTRVLSSGHRTQGRPATPSRKARWRISEILAIYKNFTKVQKIQIFILVPGAQKNDFPDFLRKKLG